MTEGWAKKLLGDVITLQRGFDLPERERAVGAVPIVSSSGITGYHSASKVRAPGVVTGRYGTLGEVFYVDADFWPLNTTLWVKDFKGNHPHYVCYLLKTLNLGRQNAAGAVPGINRNALHMLPVRVPPYWSQEKIAFILSAYDDLIGNNTRRIKILEQMAQTLYREWFVNFRFPGYEKVKMVESEIGLIPNGWQVSGIGEVTTKVGSGATPRGGKESYQTTGISLIRSLNVYDYRFEMDDLAFINDEQARQLDNVTVEPNDVLLNITGASVGRCAMVPSYILPARVNQHVAIIRANPTKIDPFYLLDTINHDRNKQTLLGIAQGGATREALTKETIIEFQILLPPFDLIRRYGQIASQLHEQREKLSRKNEVLRITRDLLLHKLVSGEISVEQIETETAAQTV